MKKNNLVHLTPAKLEKLCYQSADLAVKKASLLFIAYIMEDPSIACDEDKIVEIFTGMSRYAKAIEEHLITLKLVSQIIKDKTGIEIKWDGM